MAQKTIVIVETYSDISGDPATHFIDFSLGKMDYHLDLTDKENEEFEQALAPFLAHAQAVRTRSGKRVAVARKKDPGHAARVREWAKRERIAVPDRGRIPKEIEDRYDAAHGQPPAPTTPATPTTGAP